MGGLGLSELLGVGLNPALFGDLVIGLADGRALQGGERDELLGHAARDQLVGMIFISFPAAAALLGASSM